MDFEVTVTAVFRISGKLDIGQAASAAGDKVRQFGTFARIIEMHVHLVETVEAVPDEVPAWQLATDPSIGVHR